MSMAPVSDLLTDDEKQRAVVFLKACADDCRTTARTLDPQAAAVELAHAERIDADMARILATPRQPTPIKENQR